MLHKTDTEQPGYEPVQEENHSRHSQHDATKQSLISFSNVRRIKELQGAMDIQQRPKAKTFPAAKVSSNLITPSIKNSILEMLNGPARLLSRGKLGLDQARATGSHQKPISVALAKRRWTGPWPGQPWLTIPKMRQTLPNLRGPKSKIPTKQPKPYTRQRKKRDHTQLAHPAN